MSLWHNAPSLPELNYCMQEKHDELIELIRLNPVMRSCVQRMVCETVPPNVILKESNKPLKPELQRLIGPYFSKFLADGIEMAYMCGFVVFVLRKIHGIRLPCLLPLGSFTWSVQASTKDTKKRKREEESLYRYDVQPTHPEITVDDLYVYEFQAPRVQRMQCLPSPVDALCASLQNIRQLQSKIDEVMTWNSVKHITTSERVDIPKDQTTDGLSLLDDFRRYCVGDQQHTGLSKHYMMLNGPGGLLARTDPTLARNAWIKKWAFKTEDASNRAQIHVLPPNTDVQELNNLDMNVNLQELQTLFANEVYAYFHFTAASETAKSSQANAQFISQSEVKSMRQVSNFCKALAAYAYACAFDTDVVNVSVELPQPSGMHIQSADDIKKLSEAGTLLPGDSLQLRKGLMRNV